MNEPTVPLAALEAKLVELRKEQSQHLANLNACGGGIQILEKLIAEARCNAAADAKPAS